MSFFERLAHGFQNAALELRQLVQKQNAVVRERDFPRRGIDVAAQQSGVRSGMMRRAEGAPRHQRLPGREQADDAVNLGCFERLVQSQRGQNCGEPFGEHGFSGAGRADQQNVVTGLTKESAKKQVESLS